MAEVSKSISMTGKIGAARATARTLKSPEHRVAAKLEELVVRITAKSGRLTPRSVLDPDTGRSSGPLPALLASSLMPASGWALATSVSVPLLDVPDE